ncbi:type II secretion system protein [Lentisphaera profundi]|uniref:Type II secretion system protein n=1 Tax=Lentisphaera profundi TaxID=1658616 RepID=A0ABY7VPP9_9BACT|nr:type II secretion system protein [Lentisphaera profundi]WDE95215.1 type II secretion system protein [Lentisphaera profundi]
MNKNKQVTFTLIELLLVVAIIGILASLLLPVLGKARKQSRTAVCINQLKSLGLAISLYTDDNDDYYPPVDEKLESGHAWDDKVSIYLGRPLSNTLMAKYGIPTSDNAGGEKLFRCPNDELPAAGDFYRRTYAMIRGEDMIPGGGQDFGGVAWRNGSRTTTAVEDTAGTAMISEYPLTANYIGRANNYSHLENPEEQISESSGLHGNYKFTYLFTDGHVQNLHIYSNLGNGTPTSPAGIWTYIAND